MSTTTTPFGEFLDTGPDFVGLAEPYELALRSLVTITLRTVRETTGADLTQHGRIGLGVIEQIADEAIESAWASEQLMNEVGDRFPYDSFDRRRNWWPFVVRRECRFYRWRIGRETRARTEKLRRSAREALSSRPR